MQGRRAFAKVIGVTMTIVDSGPPRVQLTCPAGYSEIIEIDGGETDCATYDVKEESSGDRTNYVFVTNTEACSPGNGFHSWLVTQFSLAA